MGGRGPVGWVFSRVDGSKALQPPSPSYNSWGFWVTGRVGWDLFLDEKNRGPKVSMPSLSLFNPFQPHNQIETMAWCLHKDKAKRVRANSETRFRKMHLPRIEPVTFQAHTQHFTTRVLAHIRVFQERPHSIVSLQLAR